MKKKIDTIDQLIEQLENAYARWESHSRGEHCNYGCGDGAMMNMERRNIIQLKEEMAERNLESYPDILYREVPDEVDRDLWVNMRSWDARGKKLLKQYKTNSDYLFLLSVLPQLSEQQKKDTSIVTVIGYVSKFEDALNCWRDETGSDTYYRWYVRRHVVLPYFDAFEQCAAKIKQLGVCADTMFGTEESGQMRFLLG